MSLAEALKAKLAPETKNTRILTLDIESRPMMSYHWGLWDQNVSIGLILCRERNRVVVGCALRGASGPIGVAECKVLVAGLLPAAMADGRPPCGGVDRNAYHLAVCRIGGT